MEEVNIGGGGACRRGAAFKTAIDGDAAVHEAINAGDPPWRNIVVELKK
jgi:hypothetical protein